MTSGFITHALLAISLLANMGQAVARATPVPPYDAAAPLGAQAKRQPPLACGGAWQTPTASLERPLTPQPLCPFYRRYLRPVQAKVSYLTADKSDTHKTITWKVNSSGFPAGMQLTSLSLQIQDARGHLLLRRTSTIDMRLANPPHPLPTRQNAHPPACLGVPSTASVEERFVLDQGTLRILKATSGATVLHDLTLYRSFTYQFDGVTRSIGVTSVLGVNIALNGH